MENGHQEFECTEAGWKDECPTSEIKMFQEFYSHSGRLVQSLNFEVAPGANCSEDSSRDSLGDGSEDGSGDSKELLVSEIREKEELKDKDGGMNEPVDVVLDEAGLIAPIPDADYNLKTDIEMHADVKPVTDIDDNLDGSGEQEGRGIPRLEPYTEVYQFRTTVVGTRPPIWRRIQVPASYTFFDLHIAIQDTMQAWIDMYPHNFKLSDGSVVEYSEPRWNTRNGWTTMIRDHFSLTAAEVSGDNLSSDAKIGKRKNFQNGLSADDASVGEDSMDLSFKAKKPKKGSNKARLGSQTFTGSLEKIHTGSSYTLRIPEKAEDAKLMNSAAETPLEAVGSNDTLPSPVHIYQWKILDLPASPDSSSPSSPGMVIDEGPSELEQAAVETLLSLSSCSDSSGNSQQLNNMMDVTTQDAATPTSVPLTKKTKKEKNTTTMKIPKKCIYNYDPVDNWQIHVVLEHVLTRVDERNYPVCIGGKRSAPPENCGGVVGFNSLLQDISEPGTEEWAQAMRKLCDIDFLYEGLVYNPAVFNFKNIVFQDPRRLMFEAVEAVPMPIAKRHEKFLSSYGLQSNY